MSDDPQTRVLLLEAGGNDGHPYLRVPIGLGKIHSKRLFDWGYTTEAEAGLAGRSLAMLRGKVLGGSSAINMMGFTRGAPGDYDRWARNGATGWSFAEVLPYFKRVETWEGGESASRGGSGPINVEFGRSNDPIDDAVKRATRSAGYPWTDDYNSHAVGFGRTQFSIRHGRRASSARGYLRGVTSRPNLTVLTHAYAHRIIFEGTAARGVVYERHGAVATANAEGEIIVCGGALNSPQLLMLSGIGPAAHLRELGVEIRADLPVGNNLQDHLKSLLSWHRKEPPSPFHRLLRWDRVGLAFARAYLFGTGPATTLPFNLQGYIKSSPELDVPDFEFMLRTTPASAAPYFPWQQPYTDVFGIEPVLLHPRSRGTVRLRSKNPRDTVAIQFNYYSDPADIEKMRQGFRLAREIGMQPALDKFRGEEFLPGAGITSDKAIDAHLRATSAGISHPVATCRMGSDENSVLDPELRVRGVDRLRVIDASAFPDIISAHTNAAVFMLAEKGADLLRGKTAPIPIVADLSKPRELNRSF